MAVCRSAGSRKQRGAGHDLRLHHRRRRAGWLRPGQPVERGQGRAGAAAGGRRRRLEPFVPHAGRLREDDQGGCELGLGDRAPEAHEEPRSVRYTQAHGDRRRLPINAQLLYAQAMRRLRSLGPRGRPRADYRSVLPYFRRARTTSVSPTTTIPMGAARRLDAARRPADLRRPISGPGRNSASPTITTSTAGGRQASVSTS